MITGSPVERWRIDLAGPFPKSTRGHLYIMIAICAFSKFIFLAPLCDKNAITVVKAIMDNVFLKFSGGDILTINRLKFHCELLKELCQLMGVVRTFTTSHQARTNAVCERNYSTINSFFVVKMRIK